MTNLSIELTEDERLEWEAEKYSSRTLSVRVLSSGRVIICTPGLEISEVWQLRIGEESGTPFWADLYRTLEEHCTRPLSEYRPPSPSRTLQIELPDEDEYDLKI